MATKRTQQANQKRTRGSRRSAIDPASLPNAVRAVMLSDLRPQLATLSSKVPAGPGWLHEIKFDGYRLLCFLSKGKAQLVTRNGNDWTSRFQAVARAVEGIPLKSAILDGEVVSVDERGRSSFQQLQNALKSSRGRHLQFCLFDLPYCDGFDLRRTPLVERKNLLQQILAPVPSQGILLYSEHVVGNGGALFKAACEQGLEGTISKRIDGQYASTRSTDWLKNKCTHRQEFVIGGYTDPEGARIGFGSLLLGYHDRSGSGGAESRKLIYAGNVGTGFDDAMLRSLHAKLKAIETDHSPFTERPKGIKLSTIHWAKPKLIAEVKFGEWTDDGRLRHPSFIGLRTDKDPSEIVREDQRG